MELVKQYLSQCISSASNNLRLSTQKIEATVILKDAINNSANLEADFKEMKKITELRYNKNGGLNSVANYKNNQLNGLFIQYYDNGLVEYECYYLNGVINGRKITKYRNEAMMKDEFYVNGQLSGQQRQFYDNGVLKKEEFYEKGILKSSKEFNPEGKLIYTYQK